MTRPLSSSRDPERWGRVHLEADRREPFAAELIADEGEPMNVLVPFGFVALVLTLAALAVFA